MIKKILCATIILAISGCAPAQNSNRYSKAPTIQPPYGRANLGTTTDRQLIDEAIRVAVTYLDAEKNSDAALFGTVTPHTSMTVVFDWTYVNNSGVSIEKASISGLKVQLQGFLEYYKRY